jgi:hypothetical protein
MVVGAGRLVGCEVAFRVRVEGGGGEIMQAAPTQTAKDPSRHAAVLAVGIAGVSRLDQNRLTSRVRGVALYHWF